MEPTINGNVALALFLGAIIGLGIGYLYGWLHFSKSEEEAGDEG